MNFRSACPKVYLNKHTDGLAPFHRWASRYRCIKESIPQLPVFLSFLAGDSADVAQQRRINAAGAVNGMIMARTTGAAALVPSIQVAAAPAVGTPITAAPTTAVPAAANPMQPWTTTTAPTAVPAAANTTSSSTVSV